MGGTATWRALAGVRPADVCGADLRGCEPRVLPSAAARVAFARELELEAPEPGRDHPTVAPCDRLRAALLLRDDMRRARQVLADADLGIALYLGLPRRALDGLAAATTAADVAACDGEKLSRFGVASSSSPGAWNREGSSGPSSCERSAGARSPERL